jgi:hypothetical protein
LVHNEAAMREPEFSELSEIWGQGNKRLSEMDDLREFSGRYGGTPGRVDHRTNRQRWELLSEQLPLGYQKGAGEQSKEEVYDLANCGTRKAFTVIDRSGSPLLVHNCWTYDPRFPDPDKREVPFIAYPFQVPAILEMRKALGRHDLSIEKSRDQGATWLCVIVFDHAFLFDRRSSFMCVSRTEELVDRAEDPDTIFWKFDFIHENLPPWMRPKGLKRTWKHIYNPEMGSSIDGAATTGNIGAGGRRTAFFLDEFSLFPVADGFKAMASTQMTTRCRFFNGTPKGTGNAHYVINHPPSKIKKLRFHWSDHPVQQIGRYTSESGKLKILDQEFWSHATLGDVRDRAPDLMQEFDRMAQEHLPDSAPAIECYPFVLDGKVRSIYYDNECARTPIPSQIAQELDIDYIGSGESVLTQSEAYRLKALYGRDPVITGDLSYDGETGNDGAFVPDKHGPLKLWTNVDLHGRVPPGKYVLGVDVSLGTEASNSCVVVIDLQRKECVGEYAINTVSPDGLARWCYACGMWFHKAMIIWEDNGVGGNFREHLFRLGYPHVYQRKQDDTIRRKKTNKYGYATTAANKKFIIMNCVAAMKRGNYICRSKSGIEEFCYYQHTGGTVAHSATLMDIGPGGTHRENHGDRAIAHSLANHVLKDWSNPNDPQKQGVPQNCYAARREEYLRSKQDDELWQA